MTSPDPASDPVGVSPLALETAVRDLVTKFKRDEEQGYRSRDRQYAIEVLEFALRARSSPPSDKCPSCEAMRDGSDREFIEQKWRAGVREAEFCARHCSLEDEPIANPYDPDSLAGLWWLRGYESMRAICAARSSPPPPLEKFLEALKAQQIDLPEAAAKILRENLWNLYDGEPAARSSPQEGWQPTVLAWLGEWRDQMPPQAVSDLQGICGVPLPVSPAAPPANPEKTT